MKISNITPFRFNTTDPNQECWYRYYDFTKSGGMGVEVLRTDFPVIKHTPKGVVLDLGGGDTRFVQDGTRKQFAHPTDKEAIDSFCWRKRAQRRIVRNQLDRAEVAYIVGQKMLSNAS